MSMLNEHKNLLHLDEELRKLKRPDNTKRDKKKKIQAMEMQCKLKFPGGGGTPLQEANRDVPLDGVAFSRLE